MQHPACGVVPIITVRSRQLGYLFHCTPAACVASHSSRRIHLTALLMSPSAHRTHGRIPFPTRIGALITACLLLPALAAAQSGTTTPGAAVTASTSRLSDADIKAFAVLHVAITRVIDSLDAQLAEARNKTLPAQQELQKTLQGRVTDLVKKSGLTMPEFEQRRYQVSADLETRKAFDVQVAALTGAPLPGTPPPAPSKTIVPVPPGPAGVHVGHVVNAGPDTPAEMGLMPLALVEAKIAAQHAALAARAPADLAAMKLHAGHVLHALDPSIVTTGPGRGYGVKRAAGGAALHIELAARAEGAPTNVSLHAPHVAAAARAAASRADQAIALAKAIQAASDAGEAAKLVNQLIPLCNQLELGVDANHDGRIAPDATEGGLQQAQEHLGLMLAADKR